ncbi:MAG: hypothetical protein ABW215_04585 [Kibdelosporangium sp.]
MSGPAGFPLTNTLLYLAIAISPTAVCWLVLRAPRLVRKLRQQSPAADGPPIEQLAADLRRVRRLLAHHAPGTPIVRRRGTLQAYDELLRQACLAVDVRHRLDVLPPGTELELERLRVEESLRSAGLVIP